MSLKSRRIAFFIQYDLSKPSGISKKLYRKINYWKEKGHHVKVFTFSKNIEVYTDPKNIDHRLR